MSKIKALLRIFTLNLVVLCAMAFVLELVLRIFFPVEDPFLLLKNKEATDARYIESQFQPHLKLTLESNEGIPGLQGKTNFSTNNIGFRGDDWDFNGNSKDINVLMIGGSTTECLYLDDTATVTFRLQAYLNEQDSAKNINVFGAGKSGDASQDHIAMLTQRGVHLKPKVVILFCGINDLRRMASTEFDSLNMPGYPPKNFTGNLKKDLSSLLSYTQIFRRIYNVFKKKSGVSDEIRLSSNYREKIAATNNLPLGKDFPSLECNTYKNNLRTFIASCKANNITPVLMTQAVTWGEKSMFDTHWMRYVNGRKFEPAIMLLQMEKLNATMKDVALEENVLCFDLANAIQASEQFFYDDCHFNPHGADVTAKMLAQEIKSLMN